MKKLFKFVLMFFLIISMLEFGYSVFASEKELDGIGFTAQAVLNENQKDKNLGYWWLNVKPEENINLTLRVTNGNHPNTFEMTANQAITNSNLVVDYTQPLDKIGLFLSQNSKFNFYQAVRLGEAKSKGKFSFTLYPHQTIEVPVQVHIPSSGIQGQAIGGINISRKPQEAERKNGLLNVYNYAFALVLEGESVQAERLFLTPGTLRNDKQSLILENPSKLLVRDVSVSAHITNNQDKVIANLETPKGVVVPQAKFSLDFKTEEVLKNNGVYEMVTEIKEGSKSKQTNYQLKVDDSGKVTVVKARNNKGGQNPNFIVHIVLLLLALISAGAFFIVKKRKYDFIINIFNRFHRKDGK